MSIATTCDAWRASSSACNPQPVPRSSAFAAGFLIVRRASVSLAGTAPSTISVCDPGWSLVIDYRRRLLTIARRLPEPTSPIRLPLYLHRLPIVSATVSYFGPIHGASTRIPQRPYTTEGIAARRSMT